MRTKASPTVLSSTATVKCTETKGISMHWFHHRSKPGEKCLCGKRVKKKDKTIMTPLEMREAIAKKCKWYWKPLPSGLWGVWTVHRWAGEFVRISEGLPDYLSDLNAIQSAVLYQSQEFRRRFSTALSHRSSETGKLFCEMLALDWAETFVSQVNI